MVASLSLQVCTLLDDWWSPPTPTLACLQCRLSWYKRFGLCSRSGCCRPLQLAQPTAAEHPTDIFEWQHGNHNTCRRSRAGQPTRLPASRRLRASIEMEAAVPQSRAGGAAYCRTLAAGVAAARLSGRLSWWTPGCTRGRYFSRSAMSSSSASAFGTATSSCCTASHHYNACD